MNLAYPINDIANINGIEYELDMSFDNILRLFDLIEDKEIDGETKVNTGLTMLIDDKLENYEIKERASIFVDLFKGIASSDKKETKNVDIDGNPMPTVSGDDKRTHDLSQDAEYIYASFMHCYQIDLYEQQGKLHWDKFKALINGLGEETIFSRIVGIRTAEMPTGKGTEKEQERLRKLKREYELKEDDQDE